MATNWRHFSYNGESLKLETVSSSSGKYEGAFRYGKKSRNGHLALLEGDKVHFHKRPSEPRSIGVSDTGRVVVADWIKWGEATGADIKIYDTTGEECYTKHIEESAPFVDISPDGEHIVICPYNSTAYIDDVATDQRRLIHQYEIADRLEPQFVENTGDLLVQFSHDSESRPLYRIDLEGNIVWSSEEFEKEQYYQVVTFDETVSWEPLIEKCATDYAETIDDQLQHIIANKIGKARLVDAPPAKLSEVITVLESNRDVFSAKKAHEKLISQTLGNAYYRLAKVEASKPMSENELWSTLRKAGDEYDQVLPWYDGKQGLAKVLRFQAQEYRKLQRQSEALDCYKQIETLEAKFEVSLKSDADSKYISQYEEKGISPTEPEETGRLITA